MSFLSGFTPKISVAKADANVIDRRMKDASTLIKTGEDHRGYQISPFME